MMKKFAAVGFLVLAALTAVAVSPREVNRLAGITIFGDRALWKETPETVGKRMRLKFRSDGGGDERMLSAPTKGRELFECTSAEVRIFAAGGRASRIDLVLFNKGDNVVGGVGGKKNRARKNAFKKELAKRHGKLERLLRDNCGRGRKVYFGTGNLSKPMPAWEVGEHSLVLDYAEGEYLMIHIVPETALGEHRRRVSAEQRAGSLGEYADKVVRKDNGDVFIRGVPMVDQGEKGYCVPATVERVARYFGIGDIDMHKLAERFRTAGGGGTTVEGAVRGTRKLLGEYGLRMKEATKLRRQTIIRHVDQGIPILWFHFSTGDFKGRLDASLAKRAKTPIDDWAAMIAGQKKIRKGTSGAHVALLIGYNTRTGEIAVSNSWGNRYGIAWVDFEDMEQVDPRENLYVVMPRKH